jgi:hypothetical protein
MANRRDTFAKRQREADLKEKARTKAARRLAKRTEPRVTKGPEMGTDEELRAMVSGGGSSPVVAPPVPPVPASDGNPADPTE